MNPEEIRPDLDANLHVWRNSALTLFLWVVVASRGFLAALLLARLSRKGMPFGFKEGLTLAPLLVLLALALFVPMSFLQDRFTARFQRLLAGESVCRKQLQEEMSERVFLEGALLDTADRERQTVGHELHDGICQQISSATLHCMTIEKDLAKGLSPEPKRLKAISAMLDSALGQVHDLARGSS